jgi:hypothetical protein
MPPPIARAYSTSLIVTKAPPRAMARSSQSRARRPSSARADAAPFAAAQPMVTRTIVLHPASVRSSAVCPDANTAGLTARATMKAPRKQTESHEFAEDEYPHHRVAGEPFKDTPSRLLAFAIRNRHPISRLTPIIPDRKGSLSPHKYGDDDANRVAP